MTAYRVELFVKGHFEVAIRVFAQNQGAAYSAAAASYAYAEAMKKAMTKRSGLSHQVERMSDAEVWEWFRSGVRESVRSELQKGCA